MFDNCAVCECEAFWVLNYLLSDVAKELYEAYTANEMAIYTHVYSGTRPVVNIALIEHFLSKKLL